MGVRIGRRGRRTPEAGSAPPKRVSKSQPVVRVLSPTHLRRRVHARDEARARAIIVIVLEEQLARLLVEGRFRIRVDEETLDGDEDVADAEGRLPVLLERVDADLACGGDVRVEDLGYEPAW